MFVLYQIWDNLFGQSRILQKYFELLLSGTEDETFAEEVANRYFDYLPPSFYP